MNQKNKLSLMLIVSILAVLFSQQVVLAKNYNYGEALQKSIMFYEFQRSGKLPNNIRNNWRGDSALNDGLDVGLDLTGGWYDAGDHVKFNLPMAYTATMLSWAVYEYEDAFRDSGQLEYIMDEIKWTTDYLIKCHPEPNVYYYQVGNGNKDHSWWGPAEAIEAEMERPAYKVDSNNPGSAVVGEAAAALASAAVVFADEDPTYADKLTRHAEELFEFADSTRSDEGYTAASGFYDSWSGFWDELSWSAAWLYLATNDSTYLDKAESYVSNFGTENQSDVVAYKWAHNWDDVSYGAELLLAKLTEKEKYQEMIERHLDYWSIGYKGEKITYTPGGLAWLDSWGALRYAANTSFLASVYADWSGANSEKASVYEEFAKKQIDYALGSTGRSFVVGFGINPPKNPHHRTAHSSWADSQTIPKKQRHTLYGALVGGPDSTGNYEDDISNYINNEVACDYNAGFVGALAKMYHEYGGNPIANFKAIEEKTNDEFFVEASINVSGKDFVEIKAVINNKSGWPPKVADKLSFKYFINLSELIEAGYSADDVDIKTNYNQASAKVSGPHLWDEENNIYYVNADFTGAKIYPGGRSEYNKEIQFRISAPRGTSVWDNYNDFSYQDIDSHRGNDVVKTSYIPVYDNGIKVFGQEPNALPAPTVDITAPSEGEKFYEYSAKEPITIAAAALSNAEGNIDKVEFFVNDKKIGEDSTAPYNYDWLPNSYSNDNQQMKKYELKVKAVDSRGVSKFSAPINIKVKLKTAKLPDVKLIQPADGNHFDYVGEEDPIVLKANASSSNSQIKKVEFYANGDKIGEDDRVPYECNWVPVGNNMNSENLEDFKVTAKAVDERGVLALSAAINITVKFDNSIPVKSQIPGKIEAETYDDMFGIKTETCTEGGKNVGWIDRGDWMTYSVEVEETGSYTVEYRVASNGGTGEIELQSDGNILAVTAIPRTGGWQNWTTVTAEVELPAGEQKLKIYATGPQFNINWINFKKASQDDEESEEDEETQNSGDIKLNLNNSIKNGLTNTIAPNFEITNIGDNTIDLSAVKIRYYYTNSGEVEQNFWCDHAAITSPKYNSITSKVAGDFVKKSNPAASANYYVEISFATGRLEPQAKVVAKTRIARENWTNYDQSNDFSFNNAEKVGVYINDELVWGITP